MCHVISLDCYNPDTTTDGSIRYIWHADKEGVFLFSDLADPRSNEQGSNIHGLFGAVIIEPAVALYYNGICQIEENCSENAVITAPGAETFREFVLFAHNGIRLLDKNNELIKTTEQDLTGEEAGHEAPDREDTGEKGYNYRSERFLNRLRRVPAISKIFDSKVHDDPATPLLKSYVGERVVIHLLMPADKPRNISFCCTVTAGERRRTTIRRLCSSTKLLSDKICCEHKLRDMHIIF